MKGLVMSGGTGWLRLGRDGLHLPPMPGRASWMNDMQADVKPIRRAVSDSPSPVASRARQRSRPNGCRASGDDIPVVFKKCETSDRRCLGGQEQGHNNLFRLQRRKTEVTVLAVACSSLHSRAYDFS
jgi:hypothetical protein